MTKGGQSRDAECTLSPVCSQRVQNLETETSKNSTTKRKRRDLPSASAWLWIAPDPVNQQQTEQALSFLRLLSSRPTAAPWLLLSVCVRWGGDPSSVVNIYNPNYSSHPTQQQRHAVGRRAADVKSSLDSDGSEGGGVWCESSWAHDPGSGRPHDVRELARLVRKFPSRCARSSQRTLPRLHVPPADADSWRTD